MLVSIIIPVYNTERYLKKCIESLVNQTYKEIEIILVDDGSKDTSLQICRDYQKTDDRVKVYTKENGGQGSARNMGIDNSTGDYIMFVDSDDWVDCRIVERLISAAEKKQSDITVCNFYKTAFESEEIVHTIEEKFVEETIEGRYKERLFDITIYSFGKLFKSELFKKYDIRYPNHFYEDVAMLPVVYAYAERISFISEPLYVYRNQGSSTVNNLDCIYDRIKCLQTLIDYFKKYDIYDLYKEDIIKYMYERNQVNLRMMKMILNRKLAEFIEAQDKFMRSIDQHGAKFPKVTTFGSYNLMIVAKKLMGLEDAATVEDYYGGESIISVLKKDNEYINSLRFEHKNAYRRQCIINDFSKRFSNLNAAEFCDTDYVLLDFMEERYSIGICNGEVFTLSDAFKDIENTVDLNYDVLEFGTEEWKRIWRQSCDALVELLDKYVGRDKVILVKTKLAEYIKKEDGIEPYENFDDIREANKCLEWCYDYFVSKCPESHVIDVACLPTYYTNYEFRHGCYPWHLNGNVYTLMKNKIMSNINT